VQEILPLSPGLPYDPLSESYHLSCTGGSFQCIFQKGLCNDINKAQGQSVGLRYAVFGHYVGVSRATHWNRVGIA
jgi:hypothetical protein